MVSVNRDTQVTEPGATAAILCGGKSRRMGFDKCGIRLGEKPGDPLLLSHVADQLSRIFDSVILIADRADRVQATDHQVFVDLYPETGPLGAIATALHYAPTEIVFLTACDMPWVNEPLIRHMLALQAESGSQGVFSWKGDYVEPLYGLYGKSMEPLAQSQLAQGKYKIMDMIRQSRIEYLEEAEWRALTGGVDIFANLNTVEDLALLDQVRASWKEPR